MKTKRTAKLVLLAALSVSLLGWLACEFTSPPKRRAGRMFSNHNIVTALIPAPPSATAQPGGAPTP